MHTPVNFLGNTIPFYNIFLAAAFIAAVLIVEKQFNKNAIDTKVQEKIRLLNAFIILCGLFGAAFFEVIFQHKNISINSLSKTGLTFYGGLILSVIVIIAFSLFFKIKILFLANFYTLPLTLGHAIGRLGCFFAGCCFGSPTQALVGVRYPIHSIPYEHYHEIIMIHPVQIYESLGLMAVFFILTLTKSDKRLAVYFISYALLRFTIELFRADARGSIMGSTLLSPAQIISIVLFITGIFILVFPLLKPKIKQ